MDFRTLNEAAIIREMTKLYPGASWFFIWGNNGERILVSVPHD